MEDSLLDMSNQNESYVQNLTVVSGVIYIKHVNANKMYTVEADQESKFASQCSDELGLEVSLT